MLEKTQQLLVRKLVRAHVYRGLDRVVSRWYTGYINLTALLAFARTAVFVFTAHE